MRQGLRPCFFLLSSTPGISLPICFSSPSASLTHGYRCFHEFSANSGCSVLMAAPSHGHHIGAARAGMMDRQPHPRFQPAHDCQAELDAGWAGVEHLGLASAEHLAVDTDIPGAMQCRTSLRSPLVMDVHWGLLSAVLCLCSKPACRGKAREFLLSSDLGIIVALPLQIS